MNSIDLQRNNNNFDFLRIMAALFVLIGHSSDVLLNHHLSPDPAKWIFGLSIQSLGVLIFFIISGFLVTRSFEIRKSWISFFAGRVLRIFPALIAVVLLSVFVLGISLTTVSLSEYFSSQFTMQYLQNMTLYRMYYYLPGVFESNPSGGSINASLWTLPYEFTCYVYIALAGIFTFLTNKWISFFTFVLYFISYIYFQPFIDTIIIPIIGIDFKTFFIPFLYFLAGSLLYKFREKISYNLYGILICVVILVLYKIELLHHQILIPVISYFTLTIAFSSRIKLNSVAKYGDFSYGLYLYAFPVQQLLVYFLPFNPALWLMMLLSLCATLPFAFLSWHFIEKPALELKKKF